MAYNTQNFQSKLVLTASALNAMDNQIQANANNVLNISDTLSNIDNRTINIDNNILNVINQLTNLDYKVDNILSNGGSSGGNTGGGETTGGIELRFINELGYPMPSILENAVNAGNELRSLYNGENWLQLNRPTFMPDGGSDIFINVESIGNTDCILTWRGYNMPNYNNPYFLLNNVMGNVSIGDMGTTPKLLYFGPLVESVIFNAPFYLKNEMSGLNVLFSGCSQLSSVSGLEHINTTSTAFLDGAFYKCQLLLSLAGIESWDTSNVFGMCMMFSDCINISYLNISSWNTNSVWDMLSMFNNCINLSNLQLPDNFGSAATLVNNMFSNCMALTNLNLSNMNPDVTNAWGMFNNCPQLTTLTLPEHFGRSTSDLGGLLINTNVSEINGSIDLAKVQDNITWSDGIFWKNVWLDETGTEIIGDFNKIRYLVLHNIGKYNSGMEGEAVDIYAPYWGYTNSQCVIDSLVNYSYDRTAAGYPKLTINLHNNAGIVFSEDNINTLTNKGYTVNIIHIDNIGM